MDDEDSEDGNGEEAAAAADDTPAVVDGINNRSFPYAGGEYGTKSAVATVPCQPGHGADGGDEDTRTTMGPPRRG